MTEAVAALGALVVAVLVAVIFQPRRRREQRRPPIVQKSAVEVLVEEFADEVEDSAQRETDQINAASADPHAAATLARLRRGQR